MKRNLCYKHHTAEFDKLANHNRHLAADWRTVEPCEMCEAERADLLAALERVRDAAKAPQNRGAMTQLQMCRFLDGLLAVIGAALAGARGGEGGGTAGGWNGRQRPSAPRGS